MNDTKNTPKTQDKNQQVSITITEATTIEFYRERRWNGVDPYSWCKENDRYIDKLSKASLHRLIRVAENLQWEHREHDNVYMGGYYAPSISVEQIFTLVSNGDGSGNFLAGWLRQLCGCPLCWDDETGAITTLQSDENKLESE